LRIAAYLENRLSAEEREVFKQSLSEDDELRLQYVDALMNKAGTGQNSGGMEVENSGGMVMENPSGMVAENQGGMVAENQGGMVAPDDTGGVSETPEAREAGWQPETEGQQTAEVHEGREPGGNWETLGEQGAREAWEAGWQAGRKPSRSGLWGSGWMVGVAALLLVGAGVVIYILVKRQAFWDKAVAASTVESNATKKDTVAANAVDRQAAATGNNRTDSGAGNGGGAAGGKAGFADSLFAKLYKPYMRGDDPVEVRAYYQDYRTGNYAAVLAAGDSVIAATPPQKLQIRDYMRLYKGLSYLATGNGRDAITELGGVALRTKPGDVLYEVARWYLALAWLKRNDVDPAEARGKAMGLARDISHSYSRYTEPARELIRELRSL
jgi:hypothetical protein